MYYQRLSDEEILRGFRQGDSSIISEYFYGYCRVGYNIFNKKYQLSDKENLDFMSLAHQYALYLMEHDWKPLENRSANVSLKTWLINGFRYVVLDALKWHRKEYGSIPFNDYLLTFDVTNDLRQQFNKTVEELCNHAALTRDERIIIDMLLLKGFKSYEIAAQMGMTPSAISQKYVKLKKNIIEPYFKKHFDMDLDMPEVFDEMAIAESSSSIPMPKGLGDYMKKSLSPLRFMKHDKQQERSSAHTSSDEKDTNQQKRTTPEFITQLQPNEIFVFGSNLKGMHGGGAAYIAYRKFGAVMGQGVGLQGQSYAIPTMQGGVETIRPYVDEFILFARQHPEMTFLVTRIGCGIAGFTDREISPLFEQAHDVENIVLPRGW